MEHHIKDEEAKLYKMLEVMCNIKEDQWKSKKVFEKLITEINKHRTENKRGK